jgi:hypothetical protein
MVTQMKDTFDNFFKQATEAMQNSVETSVRWTEEMTRFWTQPMMGSQTMDNTLRRNEQIATEMIGLFQKNTAEGQKCVDAQCRTGMELTRKAFDAVAVEDAGELRDKSMHFMTDTVDAMRKTAEIGMNSGIQIFENWTAFLTRTMSPPERKAAAAAK